jgi:hypothetical protein
MGILAVANVLAVAVAAWAVWECRASFGSRWDASRTAGIVFFGAGAALDSPFRAMSEASFTLVERYYASTVLGHICYLIGSMNGIKFIYLRLLPDEQVQRFIGRVIAPVIAVASAVMVGAFFASPLTSTLTAGYLYSVPADGWLTLYWLTYFATGLALLLVAACGVNRLRSDPRSVMLNLLLTALLMGSLAVTASAVVLLEGHNTGTRNWVWPIGYAAIVAGSVAVVLAWRRRVRTMFDPLPGSGRPRR